jgi:hypothetical protein
VQYLAAAQQAHEELLQYGKLMEQVRCGWRRAAERVADLA